MNKKFIFKRIMVISLSLLLFIAILFGLFLMGRNQETDSMEISRYNTFRSDIYHTLVVARKEAISQNKPVFICPISKDKTQCGSIQDWKNGFIVFKNQSNGEVKKIPKKDMLKTVTMNIYDKVKAYQPEIEVLPDGRLNQHYQFIFEPKNTRLFRYQLNIEDNLYLYTKLLSA